MIQTKKKIQDYVIFLQECLGQGSFGKVYKGVNQTNEQELAIKILQKQLIDKDSVSREAFIQQINIMKKLKSDKIVRFIDTLSSGTKYYIVQQYCNGGDLRGMIKKQQKFSEQAAIKYIEQICAAFKILISNGIIHRDIKPQNILIHNNKLKLADFGFAKNLNRFSELVQTTVGTPLYMAPQILKQQKYNYKSDIWSIGLIFYELLYGKLPWTGRSQYQYINNIMKTSLSFPESKQISEEVKQFITGCLKIQQKDRFTWNQIYSNAIFKGRLVEHKNQQKGVQLKQRAKYVINKFRQKIHFDNINLQKLFNDFNLNNDRSLNQKQFYELLNTLHEDIDRQQAKYLFEFFDIDKNGKIQFTEFKKCLEQNDVRLSNIKLPNLNKINSSEDNNQIPLQQQKIIKVLSDFLVKIQRQGLTINQIYKSYDKKNSDSLQFQKFKKLLLKIDKNLTDIQCQAIFEYFDINKDSKISFDQFHRTLCKFAGQAPNLKDKQVFMNVKLDK